MAGALTLVLLARCGCGERCGRWRRPGRERVAIEDALKHLHDFEEKRLVPTLQSLAGVSIRRRLASWRGSPRSACSRAGARA